MLEFPQGLYGRITVEAVDLIILQTKHPGNTVHHNFGHLKILGQLDINHSPRRMTH